MRNVAGRTDFASLDAELELELRGAGIEAKRLPGILRSTGEVKTAVVGTLGPWIFHRAWTYWVATGPGLPLEYAEQLDRTFGQEVRASGDCACRGPRFWYKGFACPMYHVDTPAGLNALASALRECMEKA